MRQAVSNSHTISVLVKADQHIEKVTIWLIGDNERQFVEYPIFRKPGYDWGLSFNNSRAYTAMMWDTMKTHLYQWIKRYENQWSWVTMAVDADNKLMHFYLNGKESDARLGTGTASPLQYTEELKRYGMEPFSIGYSATHGGDIYFKGSIADLISVRSSIDLPVLRKDFIVTEFQVIESRILGADLILLIVAALSKSQLLDFYQLSTELGMDVLVEVHDLAEAEKALEVGAEIIGVNSRNLKTLEVSEKTFERILPELPSQILKVAESGISNRQQVELIEQLGAKAVLIGESLVRAGNPVHTIKELLNR